MEKLTSERARTPPKRLLMPRISMKSGAVCRAADSRWLGTLVMAGSEVASTRDATNKSCIGGLQPKGGELVHCAFIDRQDFDDPNDAFLRIDAGLAQGGNIHAVHDRRLIQHHLC